MIGGNAWKSSDYSKDGSALVVTIANVQGDYYIDDSVGNYVSIENAGAYVLQQNDILISLTGNVGRVSRMTSRKAVLNQRVGKITVQNRTDDEFFFQAIKRPEFLTKMNESGQGAAQMNISNSDVMNYEFQIPLFKEQCQIGVFFRSLDHLITLHQRK